jgi:hypothetical protein
VYIDEDAWTATGEGSQEGKEDFRVAEIMKSEPLNKQGKYQRAFCKMLAE